MLSGAESFTEGYDIVEYAETEEVFDVVKDNLPFYFKWLPATLKDYFADLWGYFTNRYIKSLIDTRITNTVLRLQMAGYEVDILAHSLGTVIAMCLGTKDRPLKVENFYSLNSPIGISLRTARLWVKAKLFIKARHIKFKKSYNVYGEDDFISKEMDKNGQNIFARMSDAVITLPHKYDHDYKKSLKFLQIFLRN